MKNFQQREAGLDENTTKKAPLVTKYMTRKLITFNPDTKIKDVVESLLSNRITGAPVLNNKGEVVGLIDDKDCLKLLVGDVYYNQPGGNDTVSDYMTSTMKSVSIHDDIVQIANLFLTTKYKRLLVMDDNGKLAGQVSRRDILRAIKDYNSNAW